MSECVCVVLDSETHSMLVGSDGLYMDPVPLFLPSSTLLILTCLLSSSGEKSIPGIFQ